MAWKIEFDKDALRTLSKLDKAVQKRIIKFLDDRLSHLENPRSIGDALQGKLKGFWRYRVGDYRLICEIEDENIIILVINIGHRREIYKKS